MNTIIMITANKNYDRITFSIPHSINTALSKLKAESKQSKSEIIKIAIERYLAQQKTIQLKKAVDLMLNEYENNSELIALTALDNEGFL
ncbi:hypothetical protein BPUTSESOX_778 [uncultured Gammaproteobacteria bacterium]|nr:hypothetical protein BPUTSESOX_778 [uncultured Gammaproteobacteria bacterium]